MFQVLILSILQSVLMMGMQTFLKLSLNILGDFEWTGVFWGRVFTCWQLYLCGSCALAGTLLWFYLIKRFDLSLVYPLQAVSYILALLSSQFILHELIPVTRWIGVIVIMIGVYLVLIK